MVPGSSRTKSSSRPTSSARVSASSAPPPVRRPGPTTERSGSAPPARSEFALNGQRAGQQVRALLPGQPYLIRARRRQAPEDLMEPLLDDSDLMRVHAGDVEIAVLVAPL